MNSLNCTNVKCCREEEQKYLKFISDVITDILARGIFSNRYMFIVNTRHSAALYLGPTNFNLIDWLKWKLSRSKCQMFKDVKRLSKQLTVQTQNAFPLTWRLLLKCYCVMRRVTNQTGDKIGVYSTPVVWSSIRQMLTESTCQSQIKVFILFGFTLQENIVL